MNQGSEFTKHVGRALFDLSHFAMMAATMLTITNVSDFTQEYVVGIGIGFAFAIARSVSYTLLCSTAKM